MPSLSPNNARRDGARREADPLFRREMRERWRRPLTLLQLALFATLLAAIALGFYVNIVPVGTVRIDEALTGSGRQFFRAIARLNALAWIPVGLLLAAPALAAERERGHLCDWILAGLTPRGIARAKFGALAGFVLVMACVPFPIFALCFPLGGVAPGEFAGALALTAAVAVAATATGLLISAGARRVTEALGGALLMSACLMPIGGAFLVGILAAPPVIIFACAGALALVPAGCFNAACAAFETGVSADLEGDVEAAKAPAPTPQAFEKAMRRPLLLFAPSDAPAIARPSSAARPSSQSRARLPEGFGEPESALGDLESALVWAASGNAIARREVMAHLRKPRANANANASENVSGGVLKTQRWLDFFVLWGTLGALGLALKFCWPTSAPYQWFGALVGLGLMAGATLGGASGFTRERAKRMLSALQLTALSPRDIVWGKALAALLICAQFAAGPLLAVCIMALCYGPGSALMTAILALAGAALSATASLTLSLWGRKTEVVASGALALIAAAWILLPQLYIAHGTIFQAPLWLELLWLGPLRVLGAPSGNGALALALSQLAAECALATLALGVLCAWQLQRARAEDEIKSVFQRDLSRSWH